MTDQRLTELDDLKAAWQSLDRQLERQNQLAWEQVKDRRLDTARAGLRPLYWGQAIQIGCGVLIVLLGVAAWSRGDRTNAVLVSGLILHVYGVLAIVAAGRMLSLMSRIDYAAPVVAIQRQMAELRRFYALSGMALGLAWWLLWVPFVMALAGLGGADVFASAPLMVYIGTAGGIVGLFLTWWFHRWSRHPSRQGLARFMEDAVTGRSLRRARAALDEIRRFEQEHEGT
ncbi:MAG TPA: hypothetical protein PLH72_04370 [Vicinamibacterales bacterium]|nr:hypothetical protein [Vicinamibacterales bacterium]